MPPAPEKRLVIVVRPGGKARTTLAWLRQLFPAALLLLATPSLPEAELEPGAAVVTIDADALESGPLALADAVWKGRVGS